MDLLRFKSVIQDISECRPLIIRLLAGSSLISLRQAVGFWLSNKEKQAYLTLIWDVFQNMKWIKSTERVTILGRGLDFRQVELLFQDAATLNWEKIVPFVVMVRAPVCLEHLTSWTNEALPGMKYCTRMCVTEADRPDFQNHTRPIATIKGRAAGFDVSIPVTVMTQDVPQYQLGTATLDRPAAMSIFQPILNKTNRITVAKITLGCTEYGTANVAAYQTIDTFNIVINGPPYMTNVSIILRSHCDADDPQVLMRVVDYFSQSASGSEFATLKMLTAHQDW